ncbi:MAG TPA: glycerol-3-phosphate dehydrogenase/oxidase [Symbiobacteriaceae bacterium]|nr:glycerol-3-phosphate dehydrogenase/oxidase [Symbiobacteriaceae bacterium]
MGNSRATMQSQMRNQTNYDLLIIGGGITGCGVAYEAAARGARVLLLEQNDFAFGTSSRSTKLIHGGIRYLKKANFRLVREGVHERQNLIDAAPHLVHPVQFVYPVHQGDPDPLFMLRMGLILYDLFAGRRNLLKHKVYRGRNLLSQEPLLREEGLTGGALYADCLTDDARLTVEVAKAAARRGATLVNYAQVTRFIYDEDATGARKVAGVEALDRLTGQTHGFRAGAILNATGPWADRIRALDEPDCRPILRPTKGAHLTVPHDRLPIRRPVVIHGADKRMMFAVPRDGFTYLGTTDTDYKGDPATVLCDRADVAYILDAANRIFPGARLTEADVVSTWAGLRPLAATSETAGPSQVSRDYKLYVSGSGVVSVAGGKLTAFQAMAKSIAQRMLPALSRGDVALELAGALPAPTAAEAAAMGRECGLSGEHLLELWSRHGGQTADVLRFARADLGEGRVRMLAAEAAYAVEEEFATNLADVLHRRTAQMLFSRDSGASAVEAVASAMGALLGWSSAERDAQVEAYHHEVGLMNSWRMRG